MPLKPHLVVTIKINLIRQKDTHRGGGGRKYIIFLNFTFSPSYKPDPLCRYFEKKEKTLKYATADLTL